MIEDAFAPLSHTPAARTKKIKRETLISRDGAVAVTDRGQHHADNGSVASSQQHVVVPSYGAGHGAFHQQGPYAGGMYSPYANGSYTTQRTMAQELDAMQPYLTVLFMVVVVGMLYDIRQTANEVRMHLLKQHQQM